MTQKKLFLLDGMALIYRAYFAFSQNPRVTSKGLNTSAIFGFCNTLLDVLNKEKPTHIAVVFDTSAPTERHIEYEQYKAHREAMPEDLRSNVPYIFRLIEAMNIQLLAMDGYEADDVIGTLALQAKEQGFVTYMMTPDKDFGQLVREQVYIYKPARMGNGHEILGVPEVLKKWEIQEVHQVIDILGLWGDASDNIPGVPGVGEKTAKSLIAKYGSVENIYNHLEELKGKQKENFINFKEQALLSKRLATINTQVPVHIDQLNLEVEPVNKELLEPLLAELEFRTLAKKLLGVSEPIAVSPGEAGSTDLFGQALSNEKQNAANEEMEAETVYNNIKNTTHHYELTDTPEKQLALAALLMKQGNICFDTETTSVDPMFAELVGISFSFKPHEGYYIPVPEQREGVLEILERFKSVFENEHIQKIGQNIKYDLLVLQHYGIEIKGALFDTMLAHYLIEPDQRHNMDALSVSLLGYQPISITELIGKKGTGQGNMREVELEKVKEYAAEDADITLQIKEKLEPELGHRNANELFQQLEIPLIPVLAGMERQGVKIDTDFLNQYSITLEKEINAAEAAVYEMAGIKFNLSSPKQLGDILFEHLKIEPKPKKTATGQYKTDEDVLQGLASNPIVHHILRFRQLSKLKSTYVDALPRMVHPQTGRVHTSYNQAVAATGRLSSDRPNLQNIPIRTEEGREIRKAFIPENENYIILSADYSQIELRIIASISGDAHMKEAFVNGYDIHTATAAKIYNIPMEEVNRDQRRNAKSVNFGIVYGISAFGLSQNLGIPRKEAAEIIDNYFKTYPGIKNYMSETVASAKKNGYVETMMGRRRYLRDINSANANVRGFAERNAINAPIQGSAADMIKAAMIKIDNRLKKEQLKSKMIMQVHDELVFEVLKEETEIMKTLVLEEMTAALPLSVPVIAEVGLGQNWLEAH